MLWGIFGKSWGVVGESLGNCREIVGKLWGIVGKSLEVSCEKVGGKPVKDTPPQPSTATLRKHDLGDTDLQIIQDR